jgi:hypothetical protein
MSKICWVTDVLVIFLFSGEGASRTRFSFPFLRNACSTSTEAMLSTPTVFKSPTVWIVPRVGGRRSSGVKIFSSLSGSGTAMLLEPSFNPA